MASFCDWLEPQGTISNGRRSDVSCMTLFANLLILEAIVYCGGEHYYLKGRNIGSILFKRLSTIVLGLLSCSDGAEAHFTTCPFEPRANTS